MSTKEYEVKHYTPGGLPCFCHFGYISSYHTPHNPNWHRDVEILACTKGEGYVNHDGEKIRFCQGETVIINSGISHQILTDSHVEYFYLIVDPAFQAECGFDIDLVFFQKKISDPVIYDKYMKIVEITHSDDKFRVLKTRIALSEYLLALMEKYASFSKYEADADSGIYAKKALEYLKFNYSKPISVTDIAEYVGIGRTRLTKEFKKYTGRTILEQMNIIRCKNAKNMILSGIKICEAAESCGFENRSYFTKMYKKYNKELPTQTKEKHS